LPKGRTAATAGRARILLALLTTALLAACAGAGSSPPAATEEATRSVPTATVTPEPTETGPARVRASIEASCRVGSGQGEIVVRYGAVAEGSTLLSRVRLLIDEKVSEDSGSLSQKEYRRIATLPVAPGTRHSYGVIAEAPGAPPASVRSIIQCPAAPTPAGPRL